METKTKSQKYIEEHNLEPLMAEMMNTLVYEKAHKPEVFLIKYLAGMLSKEDRAKHDIQINDSDIPQSKPIVKFPTMIKNQILRNNLDNELWQRIKYNKSKYGATINDIIYDGNLSIVDSDVYIFI